MGVWTQSLSARMWQWNQFEWKERTRSQADTMSNALVDPRRTGDSGVLARLLLLGLRGMCLSFCRLLLPLAAGTLDDWHKSTNFTVVLHVAARRLDGFK